jgi:nitrite reductase/ring-hydroxylating ferredoxin subunit
MKVLVARVADFESGERVIVNVSSWSIGVFRVGESYFAVRNRCPHAGGPICLGRIQPEIESELPGQVRTLDGKHMIECPWHGWEYDLATGQSFVDPAKLRVRPYMVSVHSAAESDSVTTPREARHFRRATSGRPVPGPYKLETFPVTISEDYVVVEIPG